VNVAKRDSLAAALERKEWFDKIKATTGFDIDEQIRRAEELSTSEDPVALINNWSKATKPQPSPK
jgi:hypothetical protein